MQLEETYQRIAAYLPKVLAAVPLAIAVILGVIVLNLIISRMFVLLARRTHLAEPDLQPIRRAVRWLLRIIATILILGVFGFQLGGLWAMVSTVLGLVAIGFVAVWSLLSNTSATMLILFLRPFQVGDDIELAGDPVRGRVVDLNFFYTTLLDHQGQLLQVPNNLFFQKTLKRRRNKPTISLAGQLNSPVPAALPPPATPEPEKPGEGKREEPNPLMNLPDPRTIAPPGR